MNIIFFGTSEFAVPALEKLVASGLRPSLVITTPDAPAGKKQILTPPPVKVRAQELGLELYQPVSLKTPEAPERIQNIQPEVGVVAAYGKMIPQAIIDLFPKGILNIHPSLLPGWRGPTPIQASILAGVGKTGATIILIDEDVDHGPILAQTEVSLSQAETYESLHGILAKIGAELLARTLPEWLEAKLSPVSQNHAQATFCKKFTRDDARIAWNQSAEEIDRMVRALNPEPGTWTTFGEPPKILKVLQSKPVPSTRETENKKCGEVFSLDKKMAVKCGQNTLILESVQPEGKKQMPAADFLRGRENIIGTTLS